MSTVPQFLKSLKQENSANRSRVIFTMMSAGLLLLISVSVYFGLSNSELKRFKQVAVKTGTVTQSVLGRGVVAPMQVATVASQLPRDRATIIWMANEGELVEKGDLIARFDPQVTENKLEEVNRELLEAKVKLLNAQKALELRQKEQKAEMESAQNSKEITLLAARDVKYGSGALQKERLEKKIEQVERKLALIEVELSDFQSIFEQGHISQRELDRTINQKREIEEELVFAKQEYQNFETYVWPKMLRESELLAEKANKDFQRAVEKSKLELERLKEEVNVTQVNVLRLNKQLAALENQLQQCNVRAPIDGMLLYKKARRSDGMRHYRIGDKVWKGQTLFEIPNTSELMIDMRIRELDISKIQRDQAAEVRVDALSSKTLDGKVHNIKRYAQEESSAGEQLFSVQVIVDSEESLLVGMSALVTITTARASNVKVLPKQAIYYQENNAFVHLYDSGEPIPRKVELGLIGLQDVEILSGVDVGDIVMVEQF